MHNFTSTPPPGEQFAAHEGIRPCNMPTSRRVKNSIRLTTTILAADHTAAISDRELRRPGSCFGGEVWGKQGTRARPGPQTNCNTSAGNPYGRPKGPISTQSHRRQLREWPLWGRLELRASKRHCGKNDYCWLLRGLAWKGLGKGGGREQADQRRPPCPSVGLFHL